MLELADIVRATGDVYQRLRGATLLPAPRLVLGDLVACRTPALGGHVQACDHCGARQYSYHSCRNRHCPKCHGEQTQRWLDRQRARLLPCAYFLLTFTLPSDLRALARAHQKIVYGVLMRAAAAALLTLTADPRYLGARPGVLAVLHSWTRALLYHPHVHMLVTAGGLRGADQTWVTPRHAAFLVPGRALSRLFRGKVRAGLRTAGLLEQVPPALWRQEWVVHVQRAGTGEKVLAYLAGYVFRIAIVNSRLERFEDGQVTFRYRDGRTTPHPALHSRRRGVPGSLSPARVAPGVHEGPPLRPLQPVPARSTCPGPRTTPRRVGQPVRRFGSPDPVTTPAPAPPPRCPVCGIGLLHVVETLPPCGRSP